MSFSIKFYTFEITILSHCKFIVSQRSFTLGDASSPPAHQKSIFNWRWSSKQITLNAYSVSIYKDMDQYSIRLPFGRNSPLNYRFITNFHCTSTFTSWLWRDMSETLFLNFKSCAGLWQSSTVITICGSSISIETIIQNVTTQAWTQMTRPYSNLTIPRSYSCIKTHEMAKGNFLV